MPPRRLPSLEQIRPRRRRDAGHLGAPDVKENMARAVDLRPGSIELKAVAKVEPRCGGLRLGVEYDSRKFQADAGHREESVDEGSWVVVLSIQLPRCEGHRSPGVLGWTAALVAAFLCASAFIATARAEDSPPTTSDDAASSSGSTTTSGATTEATETSGAPTDTAVATPSDTPGGSEGQAPDSTNGAASASTDAGASTDTSAPSSAGAPPVVAAPSSAATGSTESAPPASPPAPADRDEATIEPLVPTFRPAPETGAVGLIRRAFDCRVIVVCGLAPLTRAPSDSERVLFGRCPPREATKAGQPGARSGEGSGRPNGAQRPSSPRPPAPDHQPQGPSAPGSLLGFSSSGGSGFHSGAVLGLTEALLSLTPPEGRRLATPLERRRRALLLVFSLERPG